MNQETQEVKTVPTIRLTPEQSRAFQPKPEEAAKLARMESDAILASTAPLPGPLRDAFASDPPTFFGVKLQPITAAHIAALVKCKNPFIGALRYGMVAAQVTDPAEKTRLAAAAENLDVTAEDLFEVLHLFSLTPSEIRASGSATVPVASDGVSPSLRLMDTFPPIMPDQLSAVLANHYFESFKTALSFQQTESPEDRSKKNGESSREEADQMSMGMV